MVNIVSALSMGQLVSSRGHRANASMAALTIVGEKACTALGEKL